MWVYSKCDQQNDDSATLCRVCGSAMSTPSNAAKRSFVTVVRNDVVGSTRIGERRDPELVQHVLARYFEAARSAIERHGGTIEQFLGDAVVAIFGLPVLHEDDGLRAVRAVAELRDHLSRLNQELQREPGVSLLTRTAVNTGEVVSGNRPGQLAGDVMNVVARLEAAAQPGEILIGQPTWQLVRDAVVVEKIAPLILKGKADPVQAYRLLEVLPDAPGHARRTDIPLVGRRLELDLLAWAHERMVHERASHLITLLGPPGIGKTRLVDEFARTMGDDVAVLRGHCLPYGDAITYWPIIEIVRQAAGITASDAAQTARDRLAALVAGEDRASALLTRIMQLLRLQEGTATPEDLYWALRRLLELLARRRPLIMIIDDMNWAESPLLDLIEHVAVWSRDAPILLICMARPEFFDNRPSWPWGSLNTSTAILSPLRQRGTEQLIAHLLGHAEIDPRARSYIVEVTKGNPFFVEELVAMLLDEELLRLTGGQWTAAKDLTHVPVPMTIRATLTARLDHLSRSEQALIDRASVIGSQFHLAGLLALSPQEDPSKVTADLMALVRKQLIDPNSTTAHLPVAADDGYCFRHPLIQDAAYQRIAKGVRAALHEQYASWLSQAAERDVEIDELLGYHLEKAHGYRVEVGAPKHQVRSLARRAGERLAAAGHRATSRGDVAAITLLRHATSLLVDNDETRRAALLDLAEMLSEAGESQAALRAYEEAMQAATVAGDLSRATHARLGGREVQWFGRPEGPLGEGSPEVELAIQTFHQAGDIVGLGKAKRLSAWRYALVGQATEAQVASEEAIALARRAGDERLEAMSVRRHCFLLLWGLMPLEQVIEYNKGALEWARTRGIPSVEVAALSVLARAYAMQGRCEAARQYIMAAKEFTEGPGELLIWASDAISAGIISLLCEEPDAAERALRQGYRTLEQMQGWGPLGALTAYLARALLLQGRDAAAEQMTKVCEERAVRQQVAIQAMWRGVRAIVLARRGELKAAERLARQAVRLSAGSEQLDSQAEALIDLAEVLRYAGRPEEASSSAMRAVRLCRRKGYVVAANRAHQMTLSA
jgi:class 3 adenylate cyclase/tetratricopeptide (TPR) repeat protein